MYQYPAPGTTLNEYEFVDLYFYDFESLREYEECILLYPYGVASGRVHVRIDSTPADGLLSILVDSHLTNPTSDKVHGAKVFQGRRRS